MWDVTKSILSNVSEISLYQPTNPASINKRNRNFFYNTSDKERKYFNVGIKLKILVKHEEWETKFLKLPQNRRLKPLENVE